jgi:hypothetical protein
MKLRKFTALALLLIPALLWPLKGQAAECESRADMVKAISLPNTHFISTVFNEPSNLDFEPLMSTTVTVHGEKSCIVAHFSTQARVTDNYIVFQVLVDGIPMEGHLISSSGTPVVASNIEDYAEQLTDFPRIFAHNFFLEVERGEHTVEVLVGAGSGIDSTNPPSVSSPVLTLEY